LPLPPIDLPDGPTGRILEAAREGLFRDRYSGLTMDSLAFALGMSKKTIYLYFPSKDAIVSAILAAMGATLRRQIPELLEGPGTFPDKLERILGLVGRHFGVLGPGFLQDLQRFAPHIARELEQLKERNVPLLFGRVLQLGVEHGLVRPDIGVNFAIEYWLQVIKGMHEPAVLDRLGLSGGEVFEKGLDLFFRGLLTPEGRRQSRWGELGTAD
jgi:AcrR family transcriptional regulator